jgi:hypothetical protein
VKDQTPAQAKTQTFVLLGGHLMMVLMLAFLAESRAANGSAANQTMLLFGIALAVAAGCAAWTWLRVWPRVVFGDTPELQPVPKFMTSYIVGHALAEAPAIFGFLIADTLRYALFAISFALMLALLLPAALRYWRFASV